MEIPEFKRHVAQSGYAEPEMREYEPNLRGELHTHDFSAVLVVVRGTFLLAFETETVSCVPGEVYEVPAGVPHDERTGADGAAILLAKK